MTLQEWIEARFTGVNDFISFKKLYHEYCLLSQCNITFGSFKHTILTTTFNSKIYCIEKLRGKKFYPIMMKLVPID
jgi:hypothetical protein